MDLWIRSQEKDGLYEVDEVYIDERDSGNNDITYYIRTNGVLLGRYSSRERALEVLDEIQDVLKPQQYEVPTGRGTFTTSPNISNYVYEMPKD